MIKIMLISLLSLVSLNVYCQSDVDVKLGLGASNLGTGDKLIGKLEGEATKKWNSILSSSILLGVGYGDFYSRKVPQPTNDPDIVIIRKRAFNPTFITHLDANVFASPFGNDKIYNFKIGTGASLMYVYDDIRTDRVDHRVSLGFNAIVENEISVRQKYLIGLKTMLQPYLDGGVNLSLMLKLGKKL